MLLLPVADFMAEHGEYFGLCHLVQKCIKEDYPLHLAYAGKVGVGVMAPFRGIDLEHPAHLYPRLLHQPPDFFFKHITLQRCEFIEKRLYNVWRNKHHEQAEYEKKSPDKKPPILRARLYDPETDGQYQDSLI